MTKKLEELFDLKPHDGMEDMTQEEAVVASKQDAEYLRELDDTSDKIDSALPTVRDLATSDKELDELAELATQHFKDLMDLGMNVEPRMAGELFGAASTLLGHAISAKTAKIDKKLKTVQLQIQKARLDYQKSKLLPPEPTEGEGRELTRSELLKMALENSNSDK